MSDNTPTVIDGPDALRALGAPSDVIETCEKLKAEGKTVTATVSDGSPASVALCVDGEVVATFNHGISMGVEHEENPALAEDPRLANAPITQMQDDGLHVFVGRKELVQLLLARGIEIPIPDDVQEGGLGCSMMHRGREFDTPIEIIVPKQD